MSSTLARRSRYAKTSESSSATADWFWRFPLLRSPLSGIALFANRSRFGPSLHWKCSRSSAASIAIETAKFFGEWYRSHNRSCAKASTHACICATVVASAVAFGGLSVVSTGLSLRTKRFSGCTFGLKGCTFGLKGWSDRPWGELIVTVAEQFAFGLFATCCFKDLIQHPRTGLFDRFVFEDRSHIKVHVVVHAFKQR